MRGKHSIFKSKVLDSMEAGAPSAGPPVGRYVG